MGKQIRKTMTWKPKPNMTARQEKKAVNAAAVRFEDSVSTGRWIDPAVTLDDFIDRWLADYAEISLRADTVAGYNVMLPQIRTALGHIRLAKLQPHHIIEFLKNLAENGTRRDGKYSALPTVAAAVKQSGKSQRQLAAICGQTPSLTSRCITGQNVSHKTAVAMCNALSLKLENSFTYHGKIGLSKNTLLHCYHLLQSILSTAVKWQVIPDNPCDRVEPPRKDLAPQAVLSVEDAQR